MAIEDGNGNKAKLKRTKVGQHQDRIYFVRSSVTGGGNPRDRRSQKLAARSAEQKSRPVAETTGAGRGFKRRQAEGAVRIIKGSSVLLSSIDRS
jgi:hypothetical protein